MAMVTRVAGNEEGKGDGDNSDGNGNKGERWQQGQLQWRQCG